MIGYANHSPCLGKTPPATRSAAIRWRKFRATKPAHTAHWIHARVGMTEF